MIDCQTNSPNEQDDNPSSLRNVLEDQHFPKNKRYYNSLVEDSANNRFYLYDACGVFVELASGTGGGAVSSVNGKSGAVVLSTEDISDTLSTRKYTTAASITKLAGIEAGAQVNDITTVNGQYGTVLLHSDSIDDTGHIHKFVTAADITKLANLSGTNSGDQDLSGLVPTTRTVNTKPLSADVTLTQDDVADGVTNKQYSDAEKTKLSGIAANATENDTDVNLKDRANHTGTQLAASISDLDTAGWVSPPLTATDPGTPGQRAYEAGFLYICVNTNTWERVATATW